MATQYSLTVINNSSRNGSFAVFQQPPPLTGNVFPLAWFAVPAAPHTQVTVNWTLDRGVLSSDSSVLKPSVAAPFTPQHDYWVAFGEFTPGEVLDVDNMTNAVEVAYADSTTSRTVTLQPNDVLVVS
jgi:hypothetical protein